MKISCNQTGKSTRKLAQKFNVSPKTIKKEFKKAGVQCKKRKKVPSYSNDRLIRILKNCRKLIDIFKDKAIVMDDESYFELKNDTNGNSHFHTTYYDP